MKNKFLLSLILTAFCLPANSQTFVRYVTPQKVIIEQQKKSKFQEFLSEQGTYSIKELKITQISSDTSDKLDIRVIQASKKGGEKIFGIKLIPITPDFITKDPYILDGDELPGLLESFNEMLQHYKTHKSAGDEIFRYLFVSRAGINFEVGIKQSFSRFFFNVDQIAMNEENFLKLIEAIKESQKVIAQ